MNVSQESDLELRRYANRNNISLDEARQRMSEEKRDQVLALIDDRIADMKSTPKGESWLDRAEREKQEADWARRVHEAGIEDRYQTSTLSGWSPTEQEQLRVRGSVAAWVAMVGSPGCPSLVLQGAKGVGKTWLACGVILDRLRAGKDGLFTMAKAYTGMIRESYRKDSPRPESAILAHYSGVGLLVVDDAGRQFDTEAEKLYLFDLINERYNKGKPTLFTTNQTPAEFEAYVGEAVMDRLRQGGGKFVMMNWPSRRV